MVTDREKSLAMIFAKIAHRIAKKKREALNAQNEAEAIKESSNCSSIHKKGA